MKRKPAKQPAPSANAYYDLHTDAVEKLVSATPENTPRYSKEELEKYRSSRGKWRFPQWLKVLLIKLWFYGAVCFFVFWGLGLYVGSQLDLFFIAGIIMGMVTDLLINRALRFTEKMPGGSQRWVMVTRRGAVGFFLNLMHGLVLIFGVVTLYYVINTVALTFRGGAADAQLVGVEPILFGVFATGVDSLLITVKQTFLNIIADAKHKA